MFDKDKIFQTARAYCDATFGSYKKHPFIVEGFRQGAYWAWESLTGNLWYPASKEPAADKAIIIEYGIDDKKKYTFSSNRPKDWKDYVRKFNFTKYCYVEDILPKEKGGEE